MLQNKSTKVFSETNSFFSSTEKGIFRIMELYRTFNLHRLQLGQHCPNLLFVKGTYCLGCSLVFGMVRSFWGWIFHCTKKKARTKKKPFGLTAKQRKKQFSKKREKGSHGANREKELLNDKISMAITMIKRAIGKGIKANYALMDSWFFCEAVLASALSLGVDIMAMAKMGKAKYRFQGGDFSAQITDISIAIIEYNVFSLAKRFEAYETIGGLFAHSKDQAMELTISLRIWGFILELLRIIADLIDGDFNELIINTMKYKPENNKIFRLIESQLSGAA